tara:strand:+ start:265 stop:933 length:669 start_codon:yes stop_codon:yes gene_type:complete
MVKKFPKSIFVKSLIITVVVFLAGILLGWQLDNIRTDSILDDLLVNELDTESYILEQSFWESYQDEDTCTYAEIRLDSISDQMVELGQYLVSYEEKSLFNEAEFEYLARRYFLLEIKAYMLMEDLSEKCEVNSDYILFFYGAEDSDSERQGYVLDSLVSRDDYDLDVFSINKDYEGDGAIDSLVLYYNVTTTPVLIVNGDTRLEGYVSYGELLDFLDDETQE